MNPEIDKSSEITSEEHAKLMILYYAKCDEYRELMLLNGKLRGLLADNGVDHEY